MNNIFSGGKHTTKHISEFFFNPGSGKQAWSLSFSRIHASSYELRYCCPFDSSYVAKLKAGELSEFRLYLERVGTDALAKLAGSWQLTVGPLQWMSLICRE